MSKQRKRRNRFKEVRNEQGNLLFRYDPKRRLVEIKKGNRVELIDLRKLEVQPA